MQQTNRPSPNELIGMARRGDTTALGELLELYRNYTKLMARLQIENRFRGKLDPSDLVQETFLESHRDFPTFQGSTEQEFLAWLRQILVRNLADRVRRHYQAKRRDIRLETSLQDEIDRSSGILGREFLHCGSSPSEVAQQRETSVLLADALEQLPEHYREVLVLRHLEQLSFAEVAQRMNRSQTSVDKIWVRALTALRSTMKANP